MPAEARIEKEVPLNMCGGEPPPHFLIRREEPTVPLPILVLLPSLTACAPWGSDLITGERGLPPHACLWR